MSNVTGHLIDAFVFSNSTELEEFGISVGKLYTDHGLPLDIAFDNLPKDLDKTDKLLILNGALNWFVQHKRQSGASKNALDKQRKLNCKTIEHFIETGECGIY